MDCSCQSRGLDLLVRDAREELLEQARRRRQGELSRLLARARGNPLASHEDLERKPRFVVWELSLRCNLRCDHCGSSAGVSRPDELSLDEMFRVCDELAELGCERVTLLGGEPFVHPHWGDVARRLGTNGIRANVISNGWTLGQPGLCDEIGETGLSIVAVSLDGLERSHDRLRRRGSFARVVEGIRNLGARDIPVAVSTVVTRQSLSELPQLHASLTASNVKVWQLQVVAPLGRMRRSDPRVLLPSRLPELFDFAAAAFAASEGPRIDLADNVGYYGSAVDRLVGRHSPRQDRLWGGCYAGIQALGIDSNGDVKGCQSLPSRPPFVEGNVRERSLPEIWRDPEAFPYTRRFRTDQLHGYCRICAYGPLCKGGCTSTAVALTGHCGDNPMCLHRYEVQWSQERRAV